MRAGWVHDGDSDGGGGERRGAALKRRVDTPSATRAHPLRQPPPAHPPRADVADIAAALEDSAELELSEDHDAVRRTRPLPSEDDSDERSIYAKGPLPAATPLEAVEALGAAERRLEALAAGRPVPSPERIAAARGARDESFSQLADVLLGAAEMEPATRAAAVARHHGLVTEADSLVDEASRDAERVAAHAAGALERETRRQALATIEAEHAAALVAEAAARADWVALWAAADVEAREPAIMAEWMTRLEGLLARREKLEAQRLEARQLEDRLATAAPALAAVEERSGLPPLPGLDTGAILARLETRLVALEKQWSEVRDRAARRAAIATRLERLGAEEVRQSARVADWQGRFAAHLRSIGLGGSENPDQAEAALAVWKKVPDTLAARDKDAKRIAGIHRDGTIFTQAVDSLVTALASDLAGQLPGTAVRSLRDRVSAAREAAARREEARKALAASTNALTEAERAERTAAERLAALVAGLPGAEGDIPGFHAALMARAEAEKGLTDARALLADVAESLSESELRAELDGFDRDTAAANLREIEDEEARAESERNRAYAEGQRLRAERAGLETGLGAEIAAQERSMAAADLTAAARDWKVLRVSALLLGAALERHRAGRQDPLMQRAGALFAGLTGSTWAGLDQSFDDNDRAQLVARRHNGGGNVEIAHLSEGTRDQLYLALRLAYLESYAERAEPAPFVGDDLFASFDDERTALGLEALAAIGDRVQPLLFTHHRAVVDLAAARLGAAVDIIEL